MAESYDYNTPESPGAYTPVTRHTFWPNLILIVGLGLHAIYQVVAMSDQLNATGRAVQELTPKVKQAQYQQTKLYSLANELLHLAPTDPIAAQIVADYKVHSTQSGSSAPTGH